MKSLIVSFFLVKMAFVHSTGGQEILEDFRTFKCNPAIHTYLGALRVQYNRVHSSLTHITMVARGAKLIGWLDHQSTIQPLFLNEHLVMYNLDYRMIIPTDREHLIPLGVFGQIPNGPHSYYPMRLIEYYPELQTYLEPFQMKIGTLFVDFNARTRFVARGGFLLGWLNRADHVQPIYVNCELAIYNLDEKEPIYEDMSKLTLYGVGWKYLYNEPTGAYLPLPGYTDNGHGSGEHEPSGGGHSGYSGLGAGGFGGDSSGGSSNSSRHRGGY